MQRVIDLTLPIKHGNPGVRIEPARRLESDGWNASTLSLYSHGGTHMDAPMHFGVGSQTIDELPVDQLMGPAWVVDVRPIEPRALIGIEHIKGIAEDIQAGDSMLICTGWSERFGGDAYRNGLPRISEELARWCVAKQIRMLGVEPPSVADVNNLDELSTIHRILFEGGVIVVEGLANLSSLTGPKVTFVALPLKIADGDGAPARAIAMEDD